MRGKTRNETARSLSGDSFLPKIRFSLTSAAHPHQLDGRGPQQMLAEGRPTCPVATTEALPPPGRAPHLSSGLGTPGCWWLRLNPVLTHTGVNSRTKCVSQECARFYFKNSTQVKSLLCPQIGAIERLEDCYFPERPVFKGSSRLPLPVHSLYHQQHVPHAGSTPVLKAPRVDGARSQRPCWFPLGGWSQGRPLPKSRASPARAVPVARWLLEPSTRRVPRSLPCHPAEITGGPLGLVSLTGREPSSSQGLAWTRP